MPCSSKNKLSNIVIQVRPRPKVIILHEKLVLMEDISLKSFENKCTIEHPCILMGLSLDKHQR
jgi:hypothetical protein